MASDKTTDERIETSRMPFGDHLEELRICLIRALIGLALGTIVSLVFARRILQFILVPAVLVLHAHGERPELQALSPQEPFLLYLKVGFLSGLLVSTPWILYQVWRFVSSGLYEHERRFARRFAPVSVGLFLSGVAFMFFIVLPIVLNFFVTFSQSFDLPDLRLNWFNRMLLSQPERPPAPDKELTDAHVAILDHDPVDPPTGAVWVNHRDDTLNVRAPDGTWTVNLKPADRSRSVSSHYGIQFFVSFVFTLALGFGLAFELPVLVVFLAGTGLVSTGEMSKARRYIFFGIVVAAAVLTPPDVISQILLAVPMFALFETGLAFARGFERRSRNDGTAGSGSAT